MRSYLLAPILYFGLTSQAMAISELCGEALAKSIKVINEHDRLMARLADEIAFLQSEFGLPIEMDQEQYEKSSMLVIGWSISKTC